MEKINYLLRAFITNHSFRNVFTGVALIVVVLLLAVAAGIGLVMIAFFYLYHEPIQEPGIITILWNLPVV